MTSIKHPFRTHSCGQLNSKNIGEIVKLSGWIHKKRNHGALIFIDLRDHYGITQCILNNDNTYFNILEKITLESVVTIIGKVIKRDTKTVNNNITTGTIEINIKSINTESFSNTLPLQVNSNQEFPEETRLKYRFLDLRRNKMQKNIILRSKVINSIRNQMIQQGFLEIQTPILTSTSPEGARDFIIPSRIHPGKFYALPQAPQQFKQLLMVSGFDKYFQIAPCFRDEDARADRSPGEFYQLDFEMAFVTQEDVFQAIEPILNNIFKTFSQKNYKVTSLPFPQITFKDSMSKYGTDKPDIRNPIEIHDATKLFKQHNITIFIDLINKGYKVKMIPAPNISLKPRSFFEKMNYWRIKENMPEIGYLKLYELNITKGSITKLLNKILISELIKITNIKPGDGLFFICEEEPKITILSGKIRTKLGVELKLINPNEFAFIWVIDFPMFKYNKELKKYEFYHNPFSMPKGGLKSLQNENPINIKALQYDIICNGVEISSGAIRNHLPEIMYKTFEITGYTKKIVDNKFGAMIRAFKFGAPPHGGCAPGIDRMIMMLAEENNLREIIAFPMNQQSQDLLTISPNNVSKEQLKELNIKLEIEPFKENKLI